MSERFHVRCPDCASELVIDRATGQVLSHRPVERPRGGGHDFDRLLQDLDTNKARAEALFEQERAALDDRARVLEEKFQEAKKKAEKEGLEGPPVRPWDLD